MKSSSVLDSDLNNIIHTSQIHTLSEIKNMLIYPLHIDFTCTIYHQTVDNKYYGIVDNEWNYKAMEVY